MITRRLLPRLRAGGLWSAFARASGGSVTGGRYLHRVVCVAAAALLGVGPAGAVVIHISYSGIVTSLNSGLAGGPIAVGDAISGTLSYRTDGVVDSTPAANLGTYNGALLTHNYTVGGYAGNIAGAPFQAIGVFDDFIFCCAIPTDAIAANATGLSGPAINGLLPDRLHFSVTAPPATLGSDAIPDTFSEVSAFTSPGLWILEFGSTQQVVGSATITDVSVPLPGTLALLLLALPALVAVRRRMLQA